MRGQGSTNPTARACKSLIEPWVKQIVATAHRQGALCADFTVDDVIYIQVALISIIDASPASTPDLYERHLKLFIDGMKSRANES